MIGRGAAWAERAHRELAARGYRSGGARSAVIDRLAGGGRPVGTASVYRALAALQDAGLVHGLDLGDGERRWELIHSDGAHHHHHVVCERCGRAVAFEDPDIETAIARVADRLGADVHVHDVVLHGRCAACGRREG